MKKMNRFRAPVAAGIFLLFSCASLENTAQKPGTGTLPDISMEEAYDNGYWVTRPSKEGVISVLGVAGRRRNRDEAIAEALADSARRVALYYGVHGESAAVLNQGSGYTDYFSDFDYRLDLFNNPENYTGALIFDKDRDVLEKNGAVFVRVRYPGVSGIPAYETVMENGTPLWVKNYSADVPGFLTAVSYSKNQGSPQKTYRTSYENAIASLLPRLSSKAVNEVVDSAGNRVTRSISTSTGDLEQVMILETWVDRKTGAVWTLLVAKQKQ
jgi:hypothetical protein